MPDQQLDRLTNFHGEEPIDLILTRRDRPGAAQWSAMMHVGREEPAEWEQFANSDCPGFPHDSSFSGEWRKVSGNPTVHEHLVSSPMVGGASYGAGATPTEALAEVLTEFRVPE